MAEDRVTRENVLSALGDALVGQDPDRTHDAGSRAVLEPLSEPEAYLVGEWRGAPLYRCPARDFNGRTNEAVARHVAQVHEADRPQPDVHRRAAALGIVTAK